MKFKSSPVLKKHYNELFVIMYDKPNLSLKSIFRGQ